MSNGGVSRSIFICTKPLQILVCMLINKSRANRLYVVGAFSDSRAVSKSIGLLSYFDNVLWFETSAAAIRAAAYEKPDSIFIDSDVGPMPFFNILKFKARAKNTDVHVYEEGSGTYRADLIVGFKRAVYSFLGIGCYFGGSFLTKHVHVFDPVLYKENVPFFNDKVLKIDLNFSAWLFENRKELVEIFSPGFSIDRKGDGGDVVYVYLSGWEVDLSLIDRAPQDAKLFVKLHPHLSKDAYKAIPPKENVKFIPLALPAELLLIDLIEKYQKVVVYHHGSSSLMYVKNEAIEEIRLD